jgi:hypothetical protein
MTHTIDGLMDMWNSVFPDHILPRSQFALWNVLNGPEITHSGITATAKKYLALNCNMTTEHLTRFASACMRNAKWRTENQTHASQHI